MDLKVRDSGPTYEGESESILSVLFLILLCCVHCLL
jgi:hypothetical protein